MSLLKTLTKDEFLFLHSQLEILHKCVQNGFGNEKHLQDIQWKACADLYPKEFRKDIAPWKNHKIIKTMKSLQNKSIIYHTIFTRRFYFFILNDHENLLKEFGFSS